MSVPENEGLALKEKAAWLFKGECQFVAGAMKVQDIPVLKLPEVAFAGRSNVGKSSLLNALTHRKTLARVSHTPGRTKQVNFFSLRDMLMLVDLPGYGYAQASKKEIAGWNRLIHDYLRGRPNLRKVCVLVDARHGLKESDREIMGVLDDSAVSYQIVLTKADKVKKEDIAAIKEAIGVLMKKHPALHPEVLCTSSRDSLGLEELREVLTKLAQDWA